MTPKEFLRTDKATDFKNVAFTAEQWNAVYAWMNEFLTHEGQSLPIQNVSDTLIAWEQFKKANWYESEAVDVEKMLMDKFKSIYGR